MARPAAAWGSLPFAEQIAFFKDKLDLPTQTWQDLLGAAHDRAFVVAGAMRADLLADLHAATLKGIEKGTSLSEFRRDFEAIVAKRGWTGWTGEDTPGGRAWRTNLIYGTNMRTSYQAGRHAQAVAIAHRRPYWRWRHADTVAHPRPLHVAWDGKILRHDNDWWRSHWPPAGFGCRCRVETLSERDLERMGKSGPDPTPDDGTYEWLDKAGNSHTIPNGIDPGWDYTPGATRDLIAEVKAKAAGLPDPLGKALVEEIAQAVVTKTIEQAAQEARDDCLAWGKANNRERLIILDEKTGKELTRSDGDVRSVSFTKEMLNFIDDERHSVRLIHNHPSDMSLSGADIDTLTRNGVSGIEAAGHGGSQYSAFKIDGITPSKLRNAYEDANWEILETLISIKDFPDEIANWAHHYFLARGLDEAGLIKYQAILTVEKTKQLEPYQWLVDRCIAAAKRAAENAK